MMEITSSPLAVCQVRKALFDMLQAFEGGDPSFLEGTRWLDLFAGTGSVGIEALSRGAGHCHFIELDSWVVQSVLRPNIEACGGSSSAMVHTGMKGPATMRQYCLSTTMRRYPAG